MSVIVFLSSMKDGTVMILTHEFTGLQWPQFHPVKSSTLMEAPINFVNRRRRSFSKISVDSPKEPDLLDWIQVSQISPVRDGAWDYKRGYQGELFQLRMTNEIMKKMEALNWVKFTKNIDFSTDPGPILCQYSAPIRNLSPHYKPSPAEVALQAEEGIFDEESIKHVRQNQGAESSAFIDDEQPCSSASLMNRDAISPILKVAKDRNSSDGKNFMQTDYEVNDGVEGGISGEYTTMTLLGQFTQKTKNIQDPKELLLLANTVDSLDGFHPVQPLGNANPENEIYSVNGKRIRLRGTAIWAPPRGKFIFDLPENRDTSTMLSLQHNLCAGCGMKFDKIYARRAKVCGYYNKLFCQCCFSGEKARIPARILHNWNFKQYLVSDFAYRFLTEHEDHPVYNVTAVNANLFKRAKSLNHFKNLRIKVSHMWPFIRSCPFTEREDEFPNFGVLKTMFTSVPRRFFLFEELDIYSVLDFLAIENGNLLNMLRPLVDCGRKHIESCQRCCLKSFLCSVCMDQDGLLYPFQLEHVYQCDGCGMLSHLKCYKKNKQNWHCGRCERIRRKRLLQSNPSVSTDHSNSD